MLYFAVNAVVSHLSSPVFSFDCVIESSKSTITNGPYPTVPQRFTSSLTARATGTYFTVFLSSSLVLTDIQQGKMPVCCRLSHTCKNRQPINQTKIKKNTYCTHKNSKSSHQHCIAPRLKDMS